MVKLTPEQVEKLYELTGETPPDNVSAQNISEALIKIEKKLTPYYPEKIDDKDIKSNKNILVIDDLEVSLLQLSKLLAKSGYTAFIARNHDEALDLCKKHDFYHIFLDLFLPEAEDGLKLLEKIIKLEKTGKNDSKVVIISGTEDKELIKQCFEGGAFDFIPKTRDWHLKILDTLRRIDEIKRGPSPQIKTTIEDREKGIVSIKVKNIFKTGVIDDLKMEALNLAVSGYGNILLDLESVNRNNAEILNLVVHIFKTCASNNGSLKLYNVNGELGESLSFVFLDGVIPVFSGKSAALEEFYT